MLKPPRKPSRNPARSCTRAAILFATLMCRGVGTAAGGELEVLHYWTGGEYAGAMTLLRSRMAGQGHDWRDFGANGGIGGNGDQGDAVSLLRKRVLAGNAPAAAQLMPHDAIGQWGRQGALGGIDRLARAEGWDRLLPAVVAATLKYNGSYVAVPVHVHRNNWLWMNAAVLARAGVRAPGTWEEFFAAAEAIRRAGFVPLAHGAQPWQNLHLLETVVLGSAGPAFYRRALVELEPAALASPAMERALLTFRRLKQYTDTRRPERDWTTASQELASGQAGMQLMGEWAGPLFADAQAAGRLDYACAAAPATTPGYIFALDSVVMFKVAPAKAAAQRDFASALMSAPVQRQLNLAKGALPVRLDADLAPFGRCAQASGAAYRSAARGGTLVPSMGVGVAPSVVDALRDIVTDFWRDERMAPRTAAARMIGAAGRKP
ncbi:ABC transporter substrate-binding protein [Pseudoduganella umbonata]|uniref:Probable sugar-binding periplasmic protein n=1 Tax=Pseudoduganella umbonata TaxID=864828 RepID=A0A4P8HIH6_9BURK|nr:ABC transporter substrate-binding protein [Pseudoduganella umbonata]MBB3219222.1 glucose/mannose transport system substrate-binding protein [Pseudoduganella umbonata]QCP09343.1 carbohydrate ABC transporter substrate-binding protein [Pseudoduganella umbonata]